MKQLLVFWLITLSLILNAYAQEARPQGWNKESEILSGLYTATFTSKAECEKNEKDEKNNDRCHRTDLFDLGEITIVNGQVSIDPVRKAARDAAKAAKKTKDDTRLARENKALTDLLDVMRGSGALTNAQRDQAIRALFLKLLTEE